MGSGGSQGPGTTSSSTSLQPVCWQAACSSPRGVREPAPTIIIGAEAFSLLLAVEAFIPVLSQLHPDCLDHRLHVLQLQLLQTVHF